MTTTVLAAVAPVIVITALGFVMRRRNVLTPEADHSLLQVCLKLLYPCLIATTIIGNPVLTQGINLWLPPLAGCLTILVGYLFGFLAARVLGIPPGPDTRTFVYVTAIYNYGYTAIPLAEALFGQKTLGVMFTHNLGVEIAFWAGAGLILTHPGSKKRDVPLWRRILTYPVVSILVSIPLNLLGAKAWIPGWIFEGARMLGACGIPMALILTGATLSDYAATMRPTRYGAKAALGGSLVRLGILPVAFLALARWLPCPVELKQVLVIQSAMPCAMFPILLTRHYGGNTGMAVQIVVISTMLAMLTIPYWISFGLKFAGLSLPL
mgnify:CR=1 FL=1